MHEKIIKFLKSNGGNKKLGQILEERGQFHYGPIDYPIGKLKRIIGPEKGMKYSESLNDWNLRVSKIAEALKEGWKPEPLIATNLWVDHFTLADGNHRQEAMLREGIVLYPVIFYFKTKEDMELFIKEYASKKLNHFKLFLQARQNKKY